MKAERLFLEGVVCQFDNFQLLLFHVANKGHQGKNQGDLYEGFGGVHISINGFSECKQQGQLEK